MSAGACGRLRCRARRNRAQPRDVLFSLAQRRQMDLEGVDAEKKRSSRNVPSATCPADSAVGWHRTMRTSTWKASFLRRAAPRPSRNRRLSPASTYRGSPSFIQEQGAAGVRPRTILSGESAPVNALADVRRTRLPTRFSGTLRIDGHKRAAARSSHRECGAAASSLPVPSRLRSTWKGSGRSYRSIVHAPHRRVSPTRLESLRTDSSRRSSATVLRVRASFSPTRLSTLAISNSLARLGKGVVGCRDAELDRLLHASVPGG